tara:strand:+ start:413 stop:529 length:117 start_codon:yes stop_codon:yes gene_type:complete
MRLKICFFEINKSNNYNGNLRLGAGAVVTATIFKKLGK